MEDLEYIDNYFNNKSTPEESQLFSLRIEEDPAFAESVAFYLSSKENIASHVIEGKRERFKDIYQSQPPVRKRSVLRLWPLLAAASVLVALVLVWLLTNHKESIRELEEVYFQNNFRTLGVTMGKMDSLESGISLYNDAKYPEALRQFENIIQKDSSSFMAKKYAGIASLQLQDYDKALEYFRELETFNNLKSNPALFLQAMALMKRNGVGDTEKAKNILQLVVKNKLGEHSIAEQWLTKW
jgi:tetratricopeptide (TPR) repeat protein